MCARYTLDRGNTGLEAAYDLEAGLRATLESYDVEALRTSAIDTAAEDAILARLSA